MAGSDCVIVGVANPEQRNNLTRNMEDLKLPGWDSGVANEHIAGMPASCSADICKNRQFLRRSGLLPRFNQICAENFPSFR